MLFIHELPDRLVLSWCAEQLAQLLETVCRQQGRLIGRAAGLGLREEAGLRTLTPDVVKARLRENSNC